MFVINILKTNIKKFIKYVKSFLRFRRLCKKRTNCYEKNNLEYDVSKMAELEALGAPSFHENTIQQQYMNKFI